MRLPLFKADSKLHTVSGNFSTVGKNGLLDAVNLVCSERCRSQSSRRLAMPLTAPPDQIISCRGYLFFRYGNLLKEIVTVNGKELVDSGFEYYLSDLTPSVDRTLIISDGRLNVFPDKIQIGTDLWNPFGSTNAEENSFPFVNPRTLVYPVDPEAEDYCSDAMRLKAGMKLCFSWAAYKKFTINTIERSTLSYEAETDSISGSIRITLDDDVPLYDSPPANGTMEYCDPQNRPILFPLVFGYNQRVSFSENKIIIKLDSEGYRIPFKDFLSVGQMVKIRGSSEFQNSVTARLVAIDEDSLEFDCYFTPIKEKHSLITLTPIIPDFNYILLKDDRLFGVDNVKNRLYVSAHGNPFLFYEGDDASQDSCSIEINGTTTGIISWRDKLLCFTENDCFRILGYNSSNLRTRHLSISGMKKEMNKSLCNVGNTVYYCSDKGVMRYSGTDEAKTTRLDLPISGVKSAISDGFFVYMLDGDRIWVCDASAKYCWSEDGKDVSQLFLYRGKRYLVSKTAIYLAEDETNGSADWSFCLHNLPDDENKRVLPLYFSVNHSENTDCTLRLYCKPSSKSDWIDCGSYRLKGEGRVKIPLKKSYCDHFKIRAEGSGSFAPDNWFAVYKDVE